MMLNIFIPSHIEPYFKASIFYKILEHITQKPLRLIEISVFKDGVPLLLFKNHNIHSLPTFLYTLFLDSILFKDPETQYIFLINEFKNSPPSDKTPFDFAGLLFNNTSFYDLPINDIKRMVKIETKTKCSLVHISKILPNLDLSYKPSIFLPEIEFNDEIVDCYIKCKSDIGNWVENLCKSFKIDSKYHVEITEKALLTVSESLVRWIDIVQNEPPLTVNYDVSAPPHHALELFPTIKDWISYYPHFYDIDPESSEIEIAYDPPHDVLFLELLETISTIKNKKIQKNQFELISNYVIDLLMRLENTPSKYLYQFGYEHTIKLIEEEEELINQAEEEFTGILNNAIDIVDTFFKSYKDTKINEDNKVFFATLSKVLPLLTEQDLENLNAIGLPLNFSRKASRKVKSMIQKQYTLIKDSETKD